MTSTVANAINESVRRNLTVTLRTASPAILEDLVIECDDSAELTTGPEFWGTDERGNTWRIAVEAAR